MDKKLYTIIVHSENIAGLLNQVTAVFTRRQINIESLNVSASSIQGVHKYTITAWTDEETIEKRKSMFFKLIILWMMKSISMKLLYISLLLQSFKMTRWHPKLFVDIMLV